MINQDVLNYIRGQIALGVSRDAIKKSLASGGWSEVDMVEAFAAIDGVRPIPPPPPAPPPPPMQPIARPVPSIATISSAPAPRRRSVWPGILIVLLLILVGLAAAVYFWYPSIMERYLGDTPTEEEQQPPPPVQNTTNVTIPVINITQPTSTATTSTSTTTP